MQLKVVWSLLLQADSEGPALIFCAASWRTYDRYKTVIKNLNCRELQEGYLILHLSL